MLSSVLLVLAAASTDPAAQAKKLGAEAARLLHAKKTEAACQKYDQAARLAPQDPSLLVDLGACLHRLGLEEEALEVTRRALAGASDRRVRRTAYANLDAVDVKIDLPELGHCSNVPGADGAPVFFACAFAWTDWHTEEGATGTGVRVATSQELARAGLENPSRPLPLDQVEEERPGAKTGLADLLVYENTEDLCRCEPEDKVCRRRCPKPQTTTCRLVHVAPPHVGWVCRTSREGRVTVQAAEVQVAPDGWKPGTGAPRPARATERPARRPAAEVAGDDEAASGATGP